MELNAIAIGERIRGVRNSANYSQEKFAEIINTSTQTVSNIETGAVIPTIQTLVNIAERFDLSLDKLVGMK